MDSHVPGAHGTGTKANVETFIKEFHMIAKCNDCISLNRIYKKKV